MKNLDVEKIQELHDFLTGQSLPDGMTIPEDEQPKLSPKQAFTVIWYLQEHLRIIPDNFELCEVCGEIYDSLSEGIHLVTGDVNNACDECTTTEMEDRYKIENGEYDTI